VSKAARIPIWRETTERRAEDEERIAAGYQSDAASPFCAPDDARVLQGKAAIARIRAAAERQAVELYDRLARGEEVSESDESRARPLEEWHEDIGNVLWWKFPINEPPYAGTPLDDEWPGYHTHWTPIVCPLAPGDEP
jgi:hypothetical protein